MDADGESFSSRWTCARQAVMGGHHSLAQECVQIPSEVQICLSHCFYRQTHFFNIEKEKTFYTPLNRLTYTTFRSIPNVLMPPRLGWSANRELRANPSDCRVVLLGDPGGFTSLDAPTAPPLLLLRSLPPDDCQDGGVSCSCGSRKGHLDSLVNCVHRAKAKRWTTDGNHRS